MEEINETEKTIELPIKVVEALFKVLEIAAERGTFRLDEYKNVAAVTEILASCYTAQTKEDETE